MTSLYIDLLGLAFVLIPISYICFLLSTYIVGFFCGFLSLFLKEKIIENIRFPAMIFVVVWLDLEFIYKTHNEYFYFVCILLVVVLLCISLKWLCNRVTNYRNQKKKQKISSESVSICKSEVPNFCTETNNVGTHKVPYDDMHLPIPVESNVHFRDAGVTNKYRTVNGEYVRTTGECIIADKLHEEGIIYKYDRPLQFEGKTILYPCFTILLNSSGKRLFWEHLSSMEYDHIQKTWDCIKSVYKQYNIYEGKNLIVTREDNLEAIDDYIAMLVEIVEPGLLNRNIQGTNIDLFTSVADMGTTLPFDLEAHVYSDYGELLLPTLKGDFFRSHNERKIADALYQARISYQYESKIILEGIVCRPDFILVPPRDGKQLYWEHCGMMDIPEYRENWERKKKLYERNGIVEGDNLIITYNQITEKKINKQIECLNSYNLLS